MVEKGWFLVLAFLGALAGQSPQIHGKAACRVSRWMEQNGGKTGLAEAIRQMTVGQSPDFDR